MVEKAKKRLTPILLAVMIAALLAVSGLAAFTSDFFANASAKAEETVSADNTDSDENGDEPEGGSEQDEPTDETVPDVETSANPNPTGTNSSGQKYWNFAYTGRIQSFILSPGSWKLEVWGAQGGTNMRGGTTVAASAPATFRGGYGGYSAGIATVTVTTTIYVVVGGAGQVANTIMPNDLDFKWGGYNGGGHTASGRTDYASGNQSGGGGGATHIANKSGLLSTRASDYTSSVYVVAGGGGLYRTDEHTSVHRSRDILA